jgi:hypothetical protein
VPDGVPGVPGAAPGVPDGVPGVPYGQLITCQLGLRVDK